MSEADRLKWDARHASTEPDSHRPPAWLVEHDASVPREGRALDIASGTGRIALWASRRGLEVTAIDISAVGLAKVRAAAPTITTIARDLAEDPRLPAGEFALITCFHYRQPELWPAMRAALAPGGVLVAELLTVRNLERHAHPSRRWLVEEGELVRWADGLEVLLEEEGWRGERHTARLIARRTT